MTNEQRLEDLAQQIYIARNNEQNDVSGSELTNFIDTTITWVNQFIPELEKEAYWSWSRENDYSFGIAGGTTSIELDDDIRTIVKDPSRPVYLVKDDRVVATFDVVSPNMVKNPRRGGRAGDDRVAIVGRSLVFSRSFAESELGATIHGDVIFYLPKLARNNIELLDTVDPSQLIVLGVLKNQTLPDIVQGGLSPSFTQKYGDLLEGTKAENDLSSVAEDAWGDSFGSQVQGVW